MSSENFLFEKFSSFFIPDGQVKTPPNRLLDWRIAVAKKPFPFRIMRLFCIVGNEISFNGFFVIFHFFLKQTRTRRRQWQ
jgi:hypothetical protein